ncbi:hypothetical protein H9P43_007973 [Blastocladiella emersonii ATCC 22665]|nr:hypothetical protein H9P43_007973 [Blastocladiella emersonii ATCC 22665]
MEHLLPEVSNHLRKGRLAEALADAEDFELQYQMEHLGQPLPNDLFPLLLVLTLASEDVPSCLHIIRRAQTAKSPIAAGLIELYHLLREHRTVALVAGFRALVTAAADQSPLVPIASAAADILARRHLERVEATYTAIRRAAVADVYPREHLLERGWTYDEATQLYTPAKRELAATEPVSEDGTGDGFGLANAAQLTDFVVRLGTV